MWFTETFGNRIGLFKPSTGEFVVADIPTPDSWPGGLDIDSQGNVWFTEQLANKIGVLFSATPKKTTTPTAAQAGEKGSEVHVVTVLCRGRSRGEPGSVPIDGPRDSKRR